MYSKRTLSLARARTKLADCFSILLVGVAQIAGIGEREVRVSPLMRALEAPRLIYVARPEPEAIEPSVHNVSQPRSGIFNQLDIGLADRRLFVVAPAGYPTPFAGRISVIEPNLDHCSSRTDFLKARKEAGVAIFVRFNFHNHQTLL